MTSPRSPRELASRVDFDGLLNELLSDRAPAELARPAALLAQAVVSDPSCAGRVGPLLDRRMRYLCDQAAAQAAHPANERGGGRFTSEEDLAAPLADLVRICPPDPALLPAILDAMPARTSGSFRSLCLLLTQQTERHFRALAAADPPTFRPNLAIALNNLSVRLAHIGSYGPAAAAAREAAERFRQLAALDRQSFLPELSISLHNLSLWSTILGRREEARAATGEAVAHYRALAAEGPAVYRPRLAGALRDLSVQLATLGRQEQARAAATEAVAHFRDLAEADPELYGPDLVESLHNLARRMADLGLRREAAAARAEAESRLRPRRRKRLPLRHRHP